MITSLIELNGSKKHPLFVTKSVELAPAGYFHEIVKALDGSLGVALASNYEYPSRYSLWNFGLVDPLLTFECRSGAFVLKAHGERGLGLLRYFHDVLAEASDCVIAPIEGLSFSGRVDLSKRETDFSEEDRTRKTSTFSVIRRLWQSAQHEALAEFGLYGAFGYDLIFEFEDLEKSQPRDADQRDVVLFIPDRLFRSTVGDATGTIVNFEFKYGDHDSAQYARVKTHAPFRRDPNAFSDVRCDHAPGQYENTVSLARQEFVQGNLFEAVPGQSFYTGMQLEPSEAFEKLMRTNPSPYAFLMNLGEDEFLIGASPEMFVRSAGRKIETCPISGTIPRGADPLEDSAQILALLSSKKDEAELTMCTDVDRNDKARICVPGSVVVTGRRQIEIYSRLIHTVDHVVGELAEGYDALDAFISHMWAVTVTGAPKAWAVKFLEAHERSPRRWYAGAVGGLQSDGSVNTALTIRTIQIRKGLATVRAGATALYYSDPVEEERETRVKASALLNALTKSSAGGPSASARPESDYRPRGLNIVLVDHEDSFVNMLGGYFKIFEPNLKTYRSPIARAKLDSSVDLVIMSPGPGRPSDFDTSATLARAMELKIPVFGVCLGLQAVVEHFGGQLGVLNEPCHGVPTRVTHNGEGVFFGLDQDLEVARYHSLYAIESALPAELQATARSVDNVIMGVSHRTLNIHTVQFHPESIITSKRDIGRRMVRNVLERCLGSR